MDLTLRDLRAFVAVADTASFTRAAAQLHVSQPALSVQIRRLEETVGARLLDRNSRRVALSALGRDLLPALRKSLRDMEQVLLDARALSGGTTGTVRLACLPTFAASALPRLIERFGAAHPGVTFEIRDAIAQAVDAQVVDEAVDIGVTGGASAHPALEVLHRAVDRLVVVCPAEHRLAGKARVTLADIARETLVLTPRGTSVREVVDAALARSRRQPRVSCEPTYMMTAVAMVRGGLGITILPGSAREVRAEPELVVRQIDDRQFARPIAVIKKRGRTLPPVAHAFIDALATALRETGRP
ncbi:LysR family transcriptional regulator [Chitinasiproducens palmae]|uniref:DNA-binding transcriptional regulator, LysR family n=1 Tax=Chitinasiproducens palmae TaxID=1770053 RepID=A0A1H2PRR7_9BURK|nr:LysR family transcriptional regulator [Chitinasiproducens palmae]SDV48797.1 DNA-binding transcriptional regulator, LysR family [Chitinasiproducens palmae]